MEDSMIDHVSIGVRSLGQAKQFYDAALAALGCRCLSEDNSSLGYGAGPAVFWLYAVDGPAAADSRPGLHLCFSAPTRKSVDQFHAAALAAGGRDNGKPGLRSYGANYYAAFVVDPDGYRIEAYCGSADAG
jgi:catechol 2,3-dioxygenase-like lactoylglutathione lyase family enzyme